VENAAVLEQHRFGLQMALLGQGTPEGFVDHEFPAQAKSIDGLEGPPVRKGQEALMELLTDLRPEEDEEEELVTAPRCFCGRRGRQGRVQLNGMVAKRPYFRCGMRSCRFLSFGDLASSPEAQAIAWTRLRVGGLVGAKASLVVVGRDGFRPEDARHGSHSESLGDVEFIEALAVLAERPKVLQKLLPNANTLTPTSGETCGCHEVRLCIAGLWRSFLIDERFPMTRESETPKNPHESLAFGRCAGNQLWIPLLEKAYAKAHSSYQFAFPGSSLEVFLEELTGAVVEEVRLGPTSCGRGKSMNADELLSLLQASDGALIACKARCLPASVSSVFAMLELAGRRIRLRNPRVASISGAYETALAMLKGTPAEASTYADGSFWVNFEDFLPSFSHAYICHAASTGGSLQHTRTVEGDFASGLDGLGTRGCAVSVVAQASCQLWISCIQPLPKAARLLQPVMGHAPLPDRRLRLQSSEPISMKLEAPSKADGLWGCLWGLAREGHELGLSCLRSVRSVPVRAHDGTVIASTELLILQMDGAAFLILENPDATETFLFDGTIEGNFVVTHTARGAQLGEWCEDKNDDNFTLGVRSHWRRYKVEDIVPPSCRQLVSFHFAVGKEWDVKVLFAQATLADNSMIGHRPKNHPFSPHAILSSSCDSELQGSEAQHALPVALELLDSEDQELQLALALSLSDQPGKAATEMATGPTGPRRWGRGKEKSERCSERSPCPVCLEPMMVKALVPCCEVCVSCASLWAQEQESQGLAADEISCPLCAKCLPHTSMSALLGKEALARAQDRISQRKLQALQSQKSILPSSTLIRLGLKQCPGCGEGMQKESETCHKMICRTCRARFCFRCLSRMGTLPKWAAWRSSVRVEGADSQKEITSQTLQYGVSTTWHEDFYTTKLDKSQVPQDKRDKAWQGFAIQ
ncbi:Calpain-15 (Small optic lobes homolog), partial [Durusdinium trenchii]